MIKILDYTKLTPEEIFARNNPQSDVEDIVSDIIYNVRKNKDKALFEYEEKFDKVKLTSLQVSEDEIEEALKLVEVEFIDILKKLKRILFIKNKISSNFMHNKKETLL